MNGYLNDGKWDTALGSYEEALEGNEDARFLAHLGAGRAYMKQGQPDRASRSFEQAIQLFPEDPVPYPPLAAAYVTMGHKFRARNVLEEAVSLVPQDVKLRLELGKLLIKQQRGEKEAVKQYSKVVELYPNVPTYRILLGKALLESEKPKAAQAQFGRAIRLDPLSASVHEGIAQANAAAGRLDRAIDHYERALELEPDSQKLNLALGRLYYELSKRGEEEKRYSELAVEYFEEAARPRPGSPSNDPSSIKAYLALGKIYEEQEQPDKAIAAYERALEINPNLELAREQLETLRAGQ